MRTRFFLLAVLSTVVLCIGWGKKARSAEDLCKIAALGGGLVLDASDKNADDLMNIAALSAGGGGTLYLKNCGGFETADLMKIAAVGRAHVVFEF